MSVGLGGILLTAMSLSFSALLAHRVLESHRRDCTEKGIGVLLKEVVTVLEYALNIEIIDTLIVRVIQMMDHGVCVLSQFFQAWKQSRSNHINADRGFPALAAGNRRFLGNVVLNVSNQ